MTRGKETESGSGSGQGLARPIRVAVAGAGQMALHHAHALVRIAGIEVVCVVDPDTEARERLLLNEEIGEVRGWSDLNEALTAEAPDAVHICTPPATHVSLARTALKAGCHVYVEKPFAPTEASARQLIDIARRRNLRICAGHQLIFERPTGRVLDLLPSIVPLSHLESYFAFRPSRGEQGGGLSADDQLRDVLPHPLYTLLYFLEAARPDGVSELVAVDVAGDGTIHALVRRAGLTGSLVVTLTGRPVESYLKVVGSNGSAFADYVRSTVIQATGPGSSTVDKVLQPYRTARQLAYRSTAGLVTRLAARQRSYPGLLEIFEAFYRSIRNTGEAPPLSETHLLETTRLLEEIGNAIERPPRPTRVDSAPECDQIQSRGTDSDGELSSGHKAKPVRVVVTGGTGFLGSNVVRKLVARGTLVRVVSRKAPPPWDRIQGVDYREADLGAECPPSLLESFDGVIHCAAETRGGWQAHERNSVRATEHLLRACQMAGTPRIVHVSSLAVLASPVRKEPVREGISLRSAERSAGPYVWGKVTSERLAVELSTEAKIDLKVARPGAIVDYAAFEAPGRLGRRIGNIFVAVGPRDGHLGVVSVAFAAETLAWMMLRFEEAPDELNILEPHLPTRRELIRRLQDRNPELRVIWLPKPLLGPLSRLGIIAQRLLRREREPVRVDQAFASERYDTSRIRALTDAIENFEAPPQMLRT